MRRLSRWLLRLLITVAILGLIAFISERIAHRIAPGSVLEVSLIGPVVERGSNGVLGLLNTDETPLNSARNAIRRGASDPRIAGLSIKVYDPEMDFAQAQELVALIKSFRSHGKWVDAYVESAGESGPGNLPYMVAAAADHVSLMPQGEIDLIGVGMREMFARGTLDWLGIRPNFESIGQYKSAANMFTNKTFTPAQHEEDTALVDDLYGQIVAAVANERHLDPTAVSSLIDRAPLSAKVGVQEHLVDRLEYEDQFDERMKNKGDRQVVSYFDYTRPRSFSWFSSVDKVAVVYGSGEIDRGAGGVDPFNPTGGESMTSDDFVKAFKDISEDDSIRAVVFRVNSPGGSVIASELIRREVELCAKKKPVVISMSGYAASGGYWISTPAMKIIAEPGTITGSIGVLGGKFNVGPASSKIYLNTDAISRGANFGMFDSFTDFTPEQASLFRDQILGDTYQYFLKIVSASRHLGTEDVDKVAQGRVWTGKQALELKLVDSLGGMDEALAEAKKLAKIPAAAHVAMVEYPERPSLLETLVSGKVGRGAHALDASERMVGPVLEALGAALRGRGNLVRAAYCPVVPIL